MVYAIESEIGGVFVPVRNVEAARDWYCRLLGRSPEGDVLFGHLFVVTMKGSTGLLLDSKDFQGPHVSKPLFHFNTSNLEEARSHALSVGAANVSPIVNDAFFTFNDPDGNLLMTANVHPAPRFHPAEFPSTVSESNEPLEE
ncbi:MAG: VOC family protein [Allorhizobium sp.]